MTMDVQMTDQIWRKERTTQEITNSGMDHQASYITGAGGENFLKGNSIFCSQMEGLQELEMTGGHPP